MGTLMILYEVYLVPGASGAPLLSQETKDDTGAQEMTPEQAEQVGFHGIPDDPHGRQRRFIVCQHSDERRIHNVLEASAQVANFQIHEVEM